MIQSLVHEPLGHHASHFNNKYNSMLFNFFLLIQMLLLEIMLLYYKEFVVPAKSLLELAKLFQVLRNKARTERCLDWFVVFYNIHVASDCRGTLNLSVRCQSTEHGNDVNFHVSSFYGKATMSMHRFTNYRVCFLTRLLATCIHLKHT